MRRVHAQCDAWPSTGMCVCPTPTWVCLALAGVCVIRTRVFPALTRVWLRLAGNTRVCLILAGPRRWRGCGGCMRSATSGMRRTRSFLAPTASLRLLGTAPPAPADFSCLKKRFCLSFKNYFACLEPSTPLACFISTAAAPAYLISTLARRTRVGCIVVLSA